ncbi:MAG: PDZ domain-containing protein [Verrucomicrobia bacterium]|nr:PDZ domain-containing protein [Verrucomicrobiota bacterium]
MFLRIIALALLLSLTAAAKPPQLSPKDTRVKIEEILKAHVSHHELTPELIARAFVNYLDEIDPGKTYFLKEEVQPWINPSTELLLETVANYKKENFSNFEAIHEAILPAIERRNAIEKQIVNAPLPKDVKAEDFKNLEWAENEEALINRILSIRSLQIDAAEKLDHDIKAQFMLRLEKRRLKHEEELITESPKTRQKLVLAYVLKSVSCALDSQTAYFTPAEANQFMIQVQQRLFGIGAQLRDDLNGFTIVRLLEGGPAKDGNAMRVNDKIIAVNNEPVVGMDIIEAVELIRGPKGTPVNLTILREYGEEKREEKLDIKIIRGEVVLTETRLEKSYEPFGDGVIGILHLYSFYQDSTTSSTADLRDAIAELKRNHNLKGIILDLRNNAGGLLPQAVSVTGLFIKKGIVVSVKDNTGQVQHLRNIEDKMAWEGPLLVLTNKTSASAAEIVAQTLQDYGRAIVVGDETTYGKGTFQTFTLESANYGKINPKGEYKVTRGRYYTVSGKSPQLVGVHPDIIVPGAFSQLEIGEKYSKYPLESEQIPANFEDTLSDVPSSHRTEIVRLYKFNLQPILNTYTSYLDVLKKNSALRIEQNKNYQNFMKEISKKELSSENVENFGLSDLQLTEASNILKDLILLMQESLTPPIQSPAAA